MTIQETLFMYDMNRVETKHKKSCPLSITTHKTSEMHQHTQVSNNDCLFVDLYFNKGHENNKQ